MTASPVCLIDIGATFTKVVVSFGGYPYITRNVELGGIALTEQIQRELMLSFEDAERLKKGETVKDAEYKDVEPILDSFFKKITTEALWTIENFRDRFNLEVDSIYLYGGTCKIPKTAEKIKKLSGKETHLGVPLGFSGIIDSEEFAVAAGLSIRYKGDEDVKV
jgi:type IV pilus assembly protein PilM